MARYKLIQNCMKILWRQFAKRLLQNYSHIAYLKDSFTHLPYLLYLLQLVQLIVVKLAAGSILNSSLQPLGSLQLKISEWVRSHLTNPSLYAWTNLVIFAALTAFIILVVLKQKLAQESKQNVRKLQLKKQKLKTIVYLYAALEFIFLPCCNLNLQYYLKVIGNGTQIGTQTFIITLSIFNTLFIFGSSFVYSEGMLLGKWTFVFVLLSLESQFASVYMKLTAVLILVALSIKRPVFKRTLIRLLLFVFVMDFLASAARVTISLLYFAIFNVLIVLGELVRPAERLLSDAESENEVLIESLQKLSKGKRLQKKQKILLLTVIFKNREKIKQLAEYACFAECKNVEQFFEKVQIHNFDWLAAFFKLKLEANLRQSPKSLSLKLQQTMYSLKYQKISLEMLINIIKMKEQTLNFKNFKELKLITKIEMIFNEINIKQRECKSAQPFIVIFKKIQLYNQSILQCCEGMIEFLTRLKSSRLDQQTLLEIMGKVCTSQEKFNSYIKKIQMYKGTSTELRLYEYAMKLLNVDYEPQVLRKGDIQLGINSLINSHYIYICQNIVIDVSNRVLSELNRKREQIVDSSLDVLVPSQLKYYLKQRVDEAFQKIKDPPKFIFPFLQMGDFLLLYKIKIGIKFDLNLGINYVFNFLKSHQFQQSPSFLYSLDNDQIVGYCPLFKGFLNLHKRKLDSNTACLEIFGVDLSYLIRDCQKRQISCILKKQKSWQRNLPLNFVVLQTYNFKTVSYALIQVLTSDIQLQRSEVKFKTLENLVALDFIQEQYLQKRSKSENRNELHFCRIKHPCEDMIYVKMSALNSKYRISYIKWILSFLIIIIVALAVGIIQIGTQVISNRMNYQNVHDLLLKKEKQIQLTYTLFYQYYQYYQIFNFPQQILDIQPYNVTAIVNEYYKKSNENIVLLSGSFSNDFIIKNQSYTLQYNIYNKTLQTGPLSMLEFLTDIKISLIRNDPSFSVRNVEASQKIAHSFRNVTLQVLSESIEYIQQIIWGVNCTIIVFIVFIKILQIKLQLAYREIFKIYTQINQKQIESSLQKFSQLFYLGKKSITYKVEGQKWKDWRSVQQSEMFENLDVVISSPQLQKRQENQQQEKIRSTSISAILMKRNYLYLIPFCCLLFFYLFQGHLQAYRSNATLILQKTNHLQKSMLFLVTKSNNYFQLAMQQILPQDQRTKTKIIQNKTLYTNFFLQLPSYFDDYLKTEKQFLDLNLCNYSYLNTGSLYKGINCSLMLNGAMDTSFSSTFILFQQLVQKYQGTYISQLGKSYNRQSKYPIFMEVCFVRRTLNNMLAYLQSQFSKKVVGFIQVENQNLLGNLLRGLFIFLSVITLGAYAVKKLADEAKAVIKCIKILPKKALLDFKTAKFILKQGILQTALLIPF